MLLTIIEAAALLRTTPGAARGVLERLRVKPINLGSGRGLGLRWYRHEIDEALLASRTEKRKRPPVPRACPFSGKSIAELAAELTNPGVRQ